MARANHYELACLIQLMKKEEEEKLYMAFSPFADVTPRFIICRSTGCLTDVCAHTFFFCLHWIVVWCGQVRKVVIIFSNSHWWSHAMWKWANFVASKSIRDYMQCDINGLNSKFDRNRKQGNCVPRHTNARWPFLFCRFTMYVMWFVMYVSLLCTLYSHGGMLIC